MPPWDLLIWYAPRPDARLEVTESEVDTPARSRLRPTQYRCQVDMRPGVRAQFVTVLLPHAPARDATPLAAGITALADRPGLAAVRVKQGDRCELAVLNPEGTAVDLDAGAAGEVSTDGRAAYLDFHGAKLRGVLVVKGTSLIVGAETLLEGADRKDFEKTGPDQ